MIMNIGNDMEELIGKIDDILSSLKENMTILLQKNIKGMTFLTKWSWQ